MCGDILPQFSLISSFVQKFNILQLRESRNDKLFALEIGQLHGNIQYTLDSN